MTQPICPHIGALDTDENRRDAAAYPSFENHCFVVHLIDPSSDELESREQLLLRDQATYCLGESYRLCPRFRALQPGAGEPFSPQMLSDQFDLDNGLAFDLPPERSPRVGLWAGVASLLLVIFLCGGSLAAYTGWRLVNRGIAGLGQQVGNQPESAAPGQVILLVTQTPLPTQPGGLPVIVTAPPTPTPTSAFAFPPAVTATPDDSGQSGPIVITTPTPQNQGNDEIAAPELAPELATAVAGSLVITQPGDTPPTPTRRPTPIFVVPTSTPGIPGVPGNPETPGFGPTATLVDVTPRVNFRAAHQTLPPGECTTISWDVENARAVFLDGEGVFGRGERRTCPQFTNRIYTLVVLRIDGSEETHIVTVDVVPYTPTPTITPTNTPVLTPTPTWTPEGPPAATAIPPSYGVQLAVEGGNQKRCTAGQRCDIQLVVDNTSSLSDEIFVNLSKENPWSSALCRDNDNCGDSVLSVGVAGANRASIILRVIVPDGTAGQSYTFQLEAVSGNSGRTVSSGLVLVTLTSQ